jgi:hypothetical protein
MWHEGNCYFSRSITSSRSFTTRIPTGNRVPRELLLDGANSRGMIAGLDLHAEAVNRGQQHVPLFTPQDQSGT